MARTVTASVLSVVFMVSANAQTPTPAIVVKRAKDVVIYAPKPDYPLAARSRRLEGSGIFLLHLRLDGTVQSVEVFKSTGHSELDDSAIAAFSRWRFHPGPTKVKIPLAFTMRGAQY
jgi:TonB family protein